MRRKDLKYWIAGAIFVIIVMAATFPYMIAKSRINSLKDQLRKDGEPVTFREYAAKYYKPVPDEENGVAIFDDAYSYYVEEKNFDRLIILGIANEPLFDQKISPLLLPYVNDFLKDNKELLARMGKLIKYDYFHPEYHWNEGTTIRFNRLSKFRNVARFYALKVESLIQQNKPNEAEKALLEMFHVNKLLSQYSFPVGQLTFYACDSLALNALERSLSSLSFSAAQLKELQSCCAEQLELATKNFPCMWKIEICFNLLLSNSTYESIQGFSPYHENKYLKEIPVKCLQAYYYYSGSYINDIYYSAKAASKIKNIPVDIFSKREPELDKIDDETRKNQSGCLFSPMGVSFSVRIYREIARLRCAATACAVERYRLKHGKLPKDLNALVPEFMNKVPIDPFDGKPLRYLCGTFELEYSEPLQDKKKSIQEEFPFDNASKEFKYKTVTSKKQGFHVYSVGQDLTDDKYMIFDVQRHRYSDIGFLVIDKKQ